MIIQCVRSNAAMYAAKRRREAGLRGGERSFTRWRRRNCVATSLGGATMRYSTAAVAMSVKALTEALMAFAPSRKLVPCRRCSKSVSICLYA